MVRRSSLVWLAVAAASAGCERSAVNPTDAISVQGYLQDPGGAPRVAAAVKLFRGPPRIDGAVCPLLLGSAWKTATTASDGAFKFDFTGKDSQTSDVLGTSEGGDLARCFRLESTFGGDGSTSADFTVQVTAIQAPALRDYDAALSVSGAAGKADFSWTAPAGAAAKSFALSIETETGEPLWSATSSGGTTTASVPDYGFEGLASRAQVTASSEEKSSGTIWPLRASSERLAVAARGVAPLSRGGTCDLSATPCPLTDGRFQPTSVDKDAVTVTFPAALPLGRVVLRGLSGSGDRLVVEVSGDGTAFGALADVAYRSGLHDLPASAPTSAKAVRVKLSKTSSSGAVAKISALAELSVFP